MRKFRLAKQRYRKAVEKDPTQFAHWVRKAELHYNLGETKNALDAYKSALAKKGLAQDSFVRGLITQKMARCLYLLDRPKDADRTYLALYDQGVTFPLMDLEIWQDTAIGIFNHHSIIKSATALLAVKFPADTPTKAARAFRRNQYDLRYKSRVQLGQRIAAQHDLSERNKLENTVGG